MNGHSEIVAALARAGLDVNVCDIIVPFDMVVVPKCVLILTNDMYDESW